MHQQIRIMMILSVAFALLGCAVATEESDPTETEETDSAADNAVSEVEQGLRGEQCRTPSGSPCQDGQPGCVCGI